MTCVINTSGSFCSARLGESTCGCCRDTSAAVSGTDVGRSFASPSYFPLNIHRGSFSLTPLHPTPPHPHSTSPHLTSPHPTSTHLTSPHLTSPCLTSPWPPHFAPRSHSRALAHSGSALGSVRFSLLTTLSHHCRPSASIQDIAHCVYFVCDAYPLDAYPLDNRLASATS